MNVLILNVFVQVLLPILIGIICLGAGLALGIYIINQKFKKAQTSAEIILEEARKQAKEDQKETIKETKIEVQQLRSEANSDIQTRRNAVAELEKKVNQRELRIDNRSDSLDKREDIIISKEKHIDNLKADIEQRNTKSVQVLEEQEQKLLKISNLSEDEAKKLVMEKVENDMSIEIAGYIQDKEEEAKTIAKKKATVILANAIQQYSTEVIQEKCVSVVELPNDEMKGRIIGREGRNIRAIEAATGVDLIIDDTPEAVVISSFDPVRREIARRTMETLIKDGRIQPSRIEDLVEKYKSELDTETREIGEKIVFQVGIGKIHPELVKLIGKLKFRTSYGQSVLAHSVEVALLTGKMAAELGANELLARRAGLLHDIGKSMDAEMEGSHVDIGVELANRYHEKPEVINAIASHHGDVEANNIISVLVSASDTLSAARPGARNESLENYIKRLTQLEEICNEFAGVEKSYALQAGREIRVIVKPDKVDDKTTYKLARDIKAKIEGNLQYPGTIKVVVIRETRVNEIAK